MPIIKVAGLSLLLFAGYAFFSTLSWHSTSLENEAAQRTKIHGQNAENRIERVCYSPLAKPDCVDEARQAQRENEREEQDLAAQKVTAWWTKIMGIAALIGMALSAVGVWLVKTTFDEARKANDIAHEHQRARLLPSAEYGRTYHLSETMTVALRCENIGLSPAYRVRCFALPVTTIPELPPKDATAGFERTLKVGETNDLVEIGNIEKDYYVVGMIQYDTIFGGPKFSYFCFGFTWSQQSRKWFAVSQIPDTWPKDT